jgi:hypothetical protein
MREELERWQNALGAHDRIPDGWERAINDDPHAAVLERAGLRYEGTFEFPVMTQWNVDALIGLVYSTSFLNRAVLREQAPDFERDLRARLLAERPGDDFEQPTTFAYELARLA